MIRETLKKYIKPVDDLKKIAVIIERRFIGVSEPTQLWRILNRALKRKDVVSSAPDLLTLFISEPPIDFPLDHYRITYRTVAAVDEKIIEWESINRKIKQLFDTDGVIEEMEAAYKAYIESRRILFHFFNSKIIEDIDGLPDFITKKILLS